MTATQGVGRGEVSESDVHLLPKRIDFLELRKNKKQGLGIFWGGGFLAEARGLRVTESVVGGWRGHVPGFGCRRGSVCRKSCRYRVFTQHRG